jgi:hypothetical protein
MRGKNVFSDVVGNGRVLSESLAIELMGRESIVDKRTPCVFLSYKGDDAQSVRAIAEYLEEGGINVYLDVDDPGLQDAVRRGDDAAIARFIDLGIASSTHMMAIVSENTKSSWWVSYEVGYSKRNGNQIATLRLKDVIGLPSFLKITTVVGGIAGLDRYLIDLQTQIEEATKRVSVMLDRFVNKSVAESSGGSAHRLSKYLDA